MDPVHNYAVSFLLSPEFLPQQYTLNSAFSINLDWVYIIHH